MINKATKPLKKIFELENQINETSKSQTFINEKYAGLTAEYGDVVLIKYAKKKTDIKDMKEQTENLQKKKFGKAV